MEVLDRPVKAALPPSADAITSTSRSYAHRTVIFRKLKKLESVISMSILEPVMGEQGWKFGSGSGAIADTVNGKQRLGEIYLLADPRYTGRVSVPVLWDIKITNRPKSSACSTRRSLH
jgi:glutathionyl-hydroquinone reductase